MMMATHWYHGKLVTADYLAIARHTHMYRRHTLSNDLSGNKERFRQRRPATPASSDVSKPA